MRKRIQCLLACLVLAMPIPAIGVEIDGAIGFGGLFMPTGGAGDDLSDATGMSFRFVQVTAVTGDFAGVTPGTRATFNSFTFDPASTPVAPLWAFDFGGLTYSFDLLEVSVELQTADRLYLSGIGTANITGFVPTTMEWTFSGQQGDILFAFSSIIAPAAADEDADGVADGSDLCSGTASSVAVDSNGCSDAQVDIDGDGACNPDAPSDGPSMCVGSDAFPDDPTESADNDSDGIGDNSDPDDDNDGQSDADEIACGSDPLDSGSLSPDADNDGMPDCVDSDDDEDGVDDGIDQCANTMIPEAAPTSIHGLAKNRWALTVENSTNFTQAPPQEGSKLSFTTADTRGCSCSQIVEAAGLGNNHLKRGCSTSAMLNWINNP